MSDSLRGGLRAGAPYALAAFLLATSFGILARPVMGPVAPIVMSAVVFAGSAQFAALAVLAAGGDPAAAILAGALLNTRYLPMGVAIAPSLSGGRLLRAAQGQSMVDQSWALSSRGGGEFDIPFMHGVTLTAYPLWVLGTVAGVLGATAIDDPGKFGLDALFPAFFLALLVGGELRSGRAAVLAAAIGAAIALALVPFAAPGIPVIAASLGALVGLRGPRP
jgi:predicted branched-subunit amino acid permease